jgi:hypothetical protein
MTERRSPTAPKLGISVAAEATWIVGLTMAAKTEAVRGMAGEES